MEKTFNKAKKRFSCSWLSILLLAVLIVYSIILVVILIWAATSSVKSVFYFNNIDRVLPESLLPWEWEFENYSFVFANFEVRVRGESTWLEGMILNSLLYAGVGSLLHTGVACLVAYLASKFKYKFSNVVYWTVIACMTIPIVGADISNIQILNAFGLYDTFLGAWILKFNFMGTYFLVFHAMFSTLPNDYSEAAFLDGAGETKVFIKIILPLVSSTFFTVFLLNFITYWNDYQVPLLYLPTHPTLSYGVQYLTDWGTNDFSSVPIRMTTCFIVVIPILVLFLSFRGRIMNKVSMGGIKE